MIYSTESFGEIDVDSCFLFIALYISFVNLVIVEIVECFFLNPPWSWFNSFCSSKKPKTRECNFFPEVTLLSRYRKSMYMKSMLCFTRLGSWKFEIWVVVRHVVMAMISDPKVAHPLETTGERGQYMRQSPWRISPHRYLIVTRTTGSQATGPVKKIYLQGI